MILSSIWELFEKRIFAVGSSPGQFNQYRDRDLSVDEAAGPGVRRNNLRGYLESFEKKPPVLVLGEAPGPWGCRFSGIPFTGERQLLTHALPFGGEQSSRNDPMRKLRKKTPYVSNSARLFWAAMLQYYPNFLVWNCVPFHPYKTEDILSVRTPTKKEILDYSDILAEMVSIMRPEKIVAVGRKAQFSLGYLGFRCNYVRHPSQGGAVRFRKGIERALAFL